MKRYLIAAACSVPMILLVAAVQAEDKKLAKAPDVVVKHGDRATSVVLFGNETAPSDSAGRPSIKTVTSRVPEKVAWEYCRGRRWEMEEC